MDTRSQMYSCLKEFSNMLVTVEYSICHGARGPIYLFIYYIYHPFNGALNIRNYIVASAKIFNEK